MILDEADSARGPHPQEPWRPALAVYEPPVLPSAHGLLQYACTPKMRKGHATICGWPAEGHAARHSLSCICHLSGKALADCLLYLSLPGILVA